MDKIFKFLRKRTKKERILLMSIVNLITSNKLDGLDVKKLSGYKNAYRARVRSFRIIFQKLDNENHVIKIDEKDDTTYNF